MAEWTPESVAARLDIYERLLLYCVVSGADYVRAGMSDTVARTMVAKDLLILDRKTARLVLTARGRKIVHALLGESSPTGTS